MAALINSRYRIKQTLGDNAQGSIFLVEDTLYDDALVALKEDGLSALEGFLDGNLRNVFKLPGRESSKQETCLDNLSFIHDNPY